MRIVMQRQILINVIIFVAYVLNLPLNKQRIAHNALENVAWFFAHDRRPHSHLYRGTIVWTPPTAIYREYTVSCILCGVSEKLKLLSIQGPNESHSRSLAKPRLWNRLLHSISGKLPQGEAVKQARGKRSPNTAQKKII